jgi:LysM repeat protein
LHIFIFFVVAQASKLSDFKQNTFEKYTKLYQMKKWIFFSIISFLVFSGVHSIAQTGDSLDYLTPQDTIFLSTGLYGQKVHTHVMAPKQTLYSLARFYGMTMDELYFYNPENEGGRYGTGSEIKIPIPNRSILRYKPKDYDSFFYVPICYVVDDGETLYHISNRVFKLPIDTIMDRNNLIDATLFKGQKLMIGWMDITGVPKKYRQYGGHPLWKKSYAFKAKYFADKKVKQEVKRKGAAVYIKGAKSTSDLFVMHRQAPVGSIVQVTNPMKRRTVYAKVVAKTPPTYDPSIEIVVSPRVGKMLGARDDKFYVKTKYLR